MINVPFVKKHSERILAGLVIAIASVCGFLYLDNNTSQDLGAVIPVGGQTYYLAGSGMSSTDTSFSLTSFTIPQSGAKITDSQISDTFYLTIEPGNRTRQEIVSCTTVVQGADGTATISGCTRGLSPMTPFTASSSLQFAHSGGSPVVISNPPQLYEQVGFLENDEVITGAWTTSVTPTAAGGLATKQYVDDNVNGGAVTLDGIAPAAVAGETFATGTIVYFDTSDAEWRKADASGSASSTGVLLGIAQGAGTDGQAISGGVLTRGYDNTQTGMSAGQTLYLSDTAGATSTSAGTVSVTLGISKDTTNFYFDPVQLNFGHLNADNIWTGANTFTNATTTFDESITGHASTSIEIFTATSTWTKPAEFEYIVVEVIGGGGGGGTAQSGTLSHGSGGGAGGYAKEILTKEDLAATTSVQVLVGEAGTSAGSGGNSAFGNFLSAAGGGAGAEATVGGLGGTATGGDINVQGGHGTVGDADLSFSGYGGSNIYGTGARGRGASGNGTAATGYGGGGSGASDATNSLRSGGVGTAGAVIITTYY